MNKSLQFIGSSININNILDEKKLKKVGKRKAVKAT
jgi:hypothetical protein